MAISKDFIVKNGIVVLGKDSVQSTSTTTGALVVKGGVGISGQLNVGGTTSTIAGSLSVGTTASLPAWKLYVLGGAYFSGEFSADPTGSNINLGLNQTTGNLTAGGTRQTGSITIGRSTLTQTLSIANGAIGPSVTKTVNIGTNGLSGSTTIINIGTTANGSTSSIALNGVTNIKNNTSATSTLTGALIVSGGVGIGGDLYIGGTFYAGGQAVLTTASFFSAISEGTDIRITEGPNNTVIIANTSTLQTVTSRGSTTTNAIYITNTSASTSTTTGALQVVGGVGIGQDIVVGGSVTSQKFISAPDSTTVGSAPVSLDSFSTSQYRSAKYFISISNTATNQYQTSEIWLVHDGASAHIEQTSVFSDNAYLVTFSTNINAGVVSLIGVGIDENIKVKMQNTYITV